MSTEENNWVPKDCHHKRESWTTSPTSVTSPKCSLQQTSLKLGVNNRSVWWIFKELGRFTYCIQVAQCLTETDEWVRLQYCSLVLSMTYADPDFFNNILWFSDESHIHLNGYINWQTTRFLGLKRPNVVVQKPLHSARVTIWCTVSGHGILGPYFVEDDAQNPLTVNQETLQRDYYCPICAEFETLLPHQKPATATTVDAARWSYSPHGDNNTLVIAWFPVEQNSHSLHAPQISWPQMPTYGACWKNPFFDQMAHLEMFLNYGRRYSNFL